MTLFGLIVLLIIATFIGMLGQGLAGYSVGGCLASLVVGFIGAYLGYWLARFFRLPFFFAINVQGQTIPVIWAIIGAAILAGILGWIGRRRRFY